MTLTEKGLKIKRSLNKQHGAKEGWRIFNLMVEEKKIVDVYKEVKTKKKR